MSFFKQLYDNFEEGACALFVAVMVLCLFLQVAMRIAVGSSLAWTEELSRYSFLWAVYVGAALAVKRGGHVRITAQFMFLPTRWRLVFRAVGDIIWIGFSLYVARIATTEEMIRDMKIGSPSRNMATRTMRAMARGVIRLPPRNEPVLRGCRSASARRIPQRCASSPARS